MAFNPFRGTPTQLGSRGAVRSHVTVVGLPKALAKLTGVEGAARLELGLVMKGAAEFVEKRAKEYVPVETGNLRSGIKSTKTATYNYDVTASSKDGEVTDKAEKEYGGFVEFGTSNMEGRFFMTQAFNDVKPIVAAHLQEIARSLGRL